MILGMGVDIVEIDRIKRTWERFGMRFAEKILHPDEISALKKPEAQYLASRFAVKEAAVKALGTGFSLGIGPTDIATIPSPDGKPLLYWYNKAEERIREMGAARAHISLSHGKNTTVAVVILESD